MEDGVEDDVPGREMLPQQRRECPEAPELLLVPSEAMAMAELVFLLWKAGARKERRAWS
jgi:hypothetical protein